MKNYKTTDLKFFKNAFTNFNKKKKNYKVDDNFYHNYNRLIENGSTFNSYELGYKKAFAVLKTNSYAQKCDYIDANLFFDKKYSTMYPIKSILGPEQTKEYTKKCKKIGDISFEESNLETETIKNMSRLPPEYISEEWLKLNMNNTLEILKIDNCNWLSNDFISKIGRLNENLKELSLRNLEINNSIITNILKWGKNLEILDISSCKGLSIGVCENIFICAKSLKCLKLSNLKEVVTDGGLERISRIPTLEELDISLCSQITNVGLVSLAKNKNNILTSLDITGLINITNEGLCQLVSNNSMSLVKLKASLLPQRNINGEVINDISKCKSLTHLDLSGCIHIDIENLNSVAIMAKLENINLSGISGVNDDLAINLISANKNLKILRLSNCVSISSNFLDYVINISNSLKLLEINRTPKITDAKIEETISKKSPNLRIIRAANLEWDLKNIGYKIPLPPKEIPEIQSKEKNDKNPINQLKHLIQENKPKRIWDLIHRTRK